MKSEVPDNFPVEVFRQKLISWWGYNGRNFPWRNSKNPYHILIAEILLHRTKADQVAAVYPHFLKRFPSLAAIASAPQSEVKNILHSLGLHWRTELLHEMAKEVVEKYGGVLPLSKTKLLQLPGVGQYIASAILCFGYNLPEPILDTNTLRVIGRIIGIKISDSARRSKKFEAIMNYLIGVKEPRKLSFSLIDLAATVCTAGDNPRCDICPLKEICQFYSKEVT